MSAAEYAFIASDAAHRRARAAVAALNALGYDARHYAPGAAEARRAKHVVFCDVPPDLRGAVLDISDPAAAGPAAEVIACTAPSAEVAQAAAAKLGREVRVLPDPVEGERRPPRAARAKPRSRPLEWLAKRAGLATEAWRVRLLWIGDKAGVDAVVGAYPALEALGAELPLALHFVADPETLDAVLERIREDAPEAVRLSFEAATGATMAQALEACDFVLLPAGPRLERIAAQAGRHAILGGDPAAAIRRALARPRETLERLVRAQAELDETCAPEVVARAWVRIFMKGER